MDNILQFFIILGIVIYIMFLIYMIKQEHLHLKYTLIWFFIAFIMIILTVFPSILKVLSQIMGIKSDVNTLFLLFFFFILLVLMQITAIISRMSNRQRRLIQAYSLLEYKMYYQKIEKDYEQNYITDDEKNYK